MSYDNFKCWFRIREKKSPDIEVVVTTAIKKKTGSSKVEGMRTLGMAIPEGARWGGKKDWVIGIDDESLQINQALSTIKKGLHTRYLKMKNDKQMEPIPVDVIRAYFDETSTVSKGLIELIDEYLLAKRLAINTAKVYQLNIRSLLTRFIPTEFQTPDVSIERIDTPFLYRLEIFIRKSPKSKSGKPFAESTIREYIGKVKAIVEYAISVGYVRERLTEQYQAKKFGKIENQSFERLVSPDDLLKIETIEVPAPGNPMKQKYHRYVVKKWRMRLLFLFQRWTGLSYADLVAIGSNIRNHIQTDMSGKKSIVYQRQKSGVMAIIPLFPQTEALLEKLEYNIYPMETYEATYGTVRSMFKWYGFPYWKEVGTHTGRHVFGIEMLTMGFSMEAVSRMMGHQNIEETQKVYARIDMTKINVDLDRINLRIKITGS
jgi:integrase